MPRKNYAPAERALHIIGVLAGKSRQEINDAIAYGDAVKMVPVQRLKEIPQGSLDMLKQRYAPALGVAAQGGLNEDFWTTLWEHCVAPKKAGDL
jgi:hypothetical protein